MCEQKNRIIRWTLLSVKILRIRIFLLFRHPVFDDKTECNFFTERYILLYIEYCAMCEVDHTTTYAINETKTYTIKRNSKTDVCVNGPLVAFYDIRRKMAEVLFFCSVPDTTRDTF
jgi:hypothetical protein